MNNPINPPDNKKIYLIFFSTWIFYVIQIIIILIFSLSNMNYYKETIVLNDLVLFLISCATCIFVTFGIARNNPSFYMSSIFSTIMYDIIVIMTLIFLFVDNFEENGEYEENKNKNKGKKIVSIIIKIFELFPGFLILFNPRLIKPVNNNNANNNIANNNNNNFANNNANNNLINNNGNMNNNMNVNNGNINNNFAINFN